MLLLSHAISAGSSVYTSGPILLILDNSFLMVINFLEHQTPIIELSFYYTKYSESFASLQYDMQNMAVF
jgi:hypothetical protein